MSWAFLEILVPLVIALLLGFLIGWLVFKWRRRVIHASEWNQLASSSQQAKADLAAVRAAYEEANNEKKIAVAQATELTSDLETARLEVAEHASQNESLNQELSERREALTDVEQRASALDAELQAERRRAEELEAEASSVAGVANEVAVLEEKIAEQDRTIAQHILELKDRARLLDESSTEVERLASAREADVARIEELESGSSTEALVSDRVAEADARVAEMEAALAAARTELDVSQGRIADFDARLSTARADLDAAHARVSELEARAHGENIDDDGSIEQIGQLRVALAERDRRIAALEAAATEGATDSTEEPPGLAAPTTPPVTVIGTAGADHVDDLKVINGIGPRMEELLNTLGITSWEQLAGLDADEVAVVDDALEEFPGRIARDQWVDQARELVQRFPEHADRPTSSNFLNRSSSDPNG